MANIQAMGKVLYTRLNTAQPGARMEIVYMAIDCMGLFPCDREEIMLVLAQAYLPEFISQDEMDAVETYVVQNF